MFSLAVARQVRLAAEIRLTDIVSQLDQTIRITVINELGAQDRSKSIEQLVRRSSNTLAIAYEATAARSAYCSRWNWRQAVCTLPGRAKASF
jgi:hypothetical protein